MWVLPLLVGVVAVGAGATAAGAGWCSAGALAYSGDIATKCGCIVAIKTVRTRRTENAIATLGDNNEEEEEEDYEESSKGEDLYRAMLSLVRGDDEVAM